MKAEYEEQTILENKEVSRTVKFGIWNLKSFINICSIILCPKRVHGILPIESNIIKRLNVVKKKKEQINKRTKNI